MKMPSRTLPFALVFALLFERSSAPYTSSSIYSWETEPTGPGHIVPAFPTVEWGCMPEALSHDHHAHTHVPHSHRPHWHTAHSHQANGKNRRLALGRGTRRRTAHLQGGILSMKSAASQPYPSSYYSGGYVSFVTSGTGESGQCAAGLKLAQRPACVGTECADQEDGSNSNANRRQLRRRRLPSEEGSELLVRMMPTTDRFYVALRAHGSVNAGHGAYLIEVRPAGAAPSSGGCDSCLRAYKASWPAGSSWPPTQPVESQLMTDPPGSTIYSLARDGEHALPYALGGSAADDAPPFYVRVRADSYEGAPSSLAGNAYLRAKAWRQGEVEPSWQMGAMDHEPLADQYGDDGGWVGLLSAGSSNGGEEIELIEASWAFGADAWAVGLIPPNAPLPAPPPPPPLYPGGLECYPFTAASFVSAQLGAHPVWAETAVKPDKCLVGADLACQPTGCVVDDPNGGTITLGAHGPTHTRPRARDAPGDVIEQERAQQSHDSRGLHGFDVLRPGGELRHRLYEGDAILLVLLKHLEHRACGRHGVPTFSLLAPRLRPKG